jgi:hypothetical protein
MHNWLSGGGVKLSPNNRKTVTYARGRREPKKGLSLKEEVGQMIFQPPTSSNNCNVYFVYHLR